ncbi:MAG: hydrogenase maturation protease [Calditrichaeota bacterium]|nr:hydrogenase maturation protease [Calditrichota bacterium]MCB0291846.1 hydrogenase maturation protease [Calditrichota bacterium]MCB0314740.1 hydrogenase maturation protease [Calditrichota bacterium]MCB9090311.1 hydrogenase maturation protease [Calditrichia bacterium]
MKITVIGMGNELLSDDGAGICAARHLQTIFQDHPCVHVEASTWGGFRFIDLLAGYDAAIIIDAIQTGRKPVGYIHRMHAEALIHSVRMISFHDINFATALSFARALEIPMPEDITVFAIEVADIHTISENLHPLVMNAVERCVENVVSTLNEKFSLASYPYV